MARAENGAAVEPLTAGDGGERQRIGCAFPCARVPARGRARVCARACVCAEPRRTAGRAWPLAARAK
eukprot:3461351-Lingulodinium_polyedra.AAC.1